VVEDTTPQLGGNLDANGHSVGFDDGTGITDDSGNEQITFHKTASAVNQIGVTNAATGAAPQIAAEGADTNIDLTLAGKGSGHPRAALFGVNATADATTRFAVAAAASLFNHAGNGHQHKINKNSATDTASLLFQTGASGRAEMGTAGDDNFHFKVSADGSTWKEAIVIDRSTGAASFPLTPKRETLTANRTYYVRTDGSDSNDGSANDSGHAFLTIQKAIDTVAALDISTFAVTVSVGAGTFSAGNILKDPVGAGTCTVQGAGSTTVISVTSTNCFLGSGTTKWTLSSMKLTVATAGSCIVGQAASKILFTAIEFGSAVNSHVVADSGSVIQASGNYTITGGAANHMLATWDGHPIVVGKTVTLTGTFSFGTAFANASRGGLIEANGNSYTGGTVTGTRYNVDLNSVIFTNGGGASYFPGNSAGSSATGGQYS
jgi:hypothetical protein